MSANTPASTPAAPDATAPVQHDVHEPDALPDAGWTMREAAEACGVSLDTIKRRRRDGAFPAAAMIDGTWRIPSADLADLAATEGWTIVMPDALPDADGAQGEAAAPNVQGAVRVAELEAQLGHLHDLHAVELDRLADQKADVEQRLEQTIAERDRARNDLEAVRAELDRVKAERAELEKAVAVAEAVEVEVRGQVDDAHVERDLVRARADAAVDSLGWMGRRRFRRAQQATGDES